MAKLAIGSAQFGLNYGISNTYGQISEVNVQKILKHAQRSGVDLVDTAFNYGTSQKLIGDFIQAGTGKMDVVTKIPSATETDVPTLLNESLRLLHSSRIYGCLIHSFQAYKERPEIFDELVKCRDQGIVEKIGFSLYFTEELETLLKSNLQFDLVQVPYNIFDRRFEKHFSELKKRNIEIHIRSVFLQGVVFLDVNNMNPFFSPLSSNLIVLNDISRKSGISVAGLCVGFTLCNREIDRVIIGVASLKDIKENLIHAKNADQAMKYVPELEKLCVTDENMIIPMRWPKN